TRNKLLGRNHARLAAAYRPGLGGQHVADGIERLLGLTLLNEPKEGVENDHAKDDCRVDPQVQHQLGKPCGEQHVDQNIVELREKPCKWASFSTFRQTVWAVFLKSERGLSRIKASLAAGIKSLHDLMLRYRVPGPHLIGRVRIRCAHAFALRNA